MLIKQLVSIALLSVLTASRLPGQVVDIAPQRGQTAAAITWTDDNGRIRQLSEFAGHPLILLPIYTRCRGACVQNVAQLKNMLGDSSTDPTQYRVLLFSFDNTDTPSALVNYRRRENIPLGWYVGTASQPNIDALVQSIGFQYGKAGTEFMHANVLVFLDSRLRIAKWIYGTDYSARDIEQGLKVASGQNDWIGQHSQWLYAAFLFAASLLCVALTYYLRKLAELRRSSGGRDGRTPNAARA